MLQIVFFILLGWIISKVYRKIKNDVHNQRYKQTENEAYELSDVPDVPCGFGYKTCWLAIKSDKPETVISALHYNNACCANWKTGIEASYNDNIVFISPKCNGFVLVVGVPEFDEMKDALAKIASEFDEVQFFGSHRIVEYCAWIKYNSGKLTRGYEWLGERGEVLKNDGELTQEEKELGFVCFPQGGEESWEELKFPNEEDVINIAKLWSVNPLFPYNTEEPSTGFICQIK